MGPKKSFKLFLLSKNHTIARNLLFDLKTQLQFSFLAKLYHFVCYYPYSHWMVFLKPGSYRIGQFLHHPSIYVICIYFFRISISVFVMDYFQGDGKESDILSEGSSEGVSSDELTDSAFVSCLLTLLPSKVDSLILPRLCLKALVLKLGWRLACLLQIEKMKLI